jgi:hypothetical protein
MATNNVRHTFGKSLLLLLKSAIASSGRKYDCIGVLASKSS